jgi:hypothetical protein
LRRLTYSLRNHQKPATGGWAPAAGFYPLVPAIGFVLLAGLSWLYMTSSDLYTRIISWWIHITSPLPFIDLAAIPAWQRCWQQHGFDVYSSASFPSCGVAPIIYSPLWLRLTFLPTDPAWTNWLGLPLVSAFLLSLGLLPQSQRIADRAIIVLATFSSPPVFAMERANMDLVIFLLAVGAALCFSGPLGRRVFGYGLMLLGGLLKFYPLVALILVLRERLAVMIAIGLAATAIIVGSAWVYLDELRRLTAVPSGAPFHYMWGGRNIPTGFPTVVRALLHASGIHSPLIETLTASPWVPTILYALLFAIALLMALRLAGRTDLRTSLAELPDRTHQFLLVGGVLIVGCFFAGQNIYYRGVFLLLIVPGILALTEISATRSLRRIYTLTTASILCVLSELSLRHIAADLFGGSYLLMEDSLLIYTIWAVKELAWWWLVTVLIAVLIRFAIGSPVWKDPRLSALGRRMSSATKFVRSLAGEHIPFETGEMASPESGTTTTPPGIRRPMPRPVRRTCHFSTALATHLGAE